MKIKLLASTNLSVTKEKILVFPFFSGETISSGNKELDKKISLFSGLYLKLDSGEFRIAFYDQGSFLFLNIGDRKNWKVKEFLLAIRKSVRIIKDNKILNASIFLDSLLPQEDIFSQIVENILLAEYDFSKYKKESGFTINNIEIITSRLLEAQKGIKRGTVIGESLNFARDLSNTPGGEMTPSLLATVAVKELSKLKNLRTEVFNLKKIKELKMGGILGVSQGSAEEPKMILVEYLGKKKDKKIDLAFIGKGLTFDSGGLNIKTGDSMLGMHMDMSGGASVLAAIRAIALLNLPINIMCFIPAVENMPSGNSYRPGDLLRAYNGKIIEVKNTDAEGRIILADALSFAVKKYKPELIIDVATLTGASVIALGNRAIAMFTNKDEMESDFRKIGDKSGDIVWPLPCWDEYQEEIASFFGDVANTGSNKGVGGAILAAMFLKNFIDGHPWIHLDIATTMTSIENQGMAKGATGTGVRYLIQFAQEFEEIKKGLK